MCHRYLKKFDELSRSYCYEKSLDVLMSKLPVDCSVLLTQQYIGNDTNHYNSHDVTIDKVVKLDLLLSKLCLQKLTKLLIFFLSKEAEVGLRVLNSCNVRLSKVHQVFLLIS